MCTCSKVIAKVVAKEDQSVAQESLVNIICTCSEGDRKGAHERGSERCSMIHPKE